MEQYEWRKLLLEGKALLNEKKLDLDGVSKKTAINRIYSVAEPIIKGIHRDETWKPIKKLWTLLDRLGAKVELEDSRYEDKKGGKGFPPARKIWEFNISFIDKTGRMKKISGRLTAHGAGDVDDPLDKYDITLVMY